MNANHACEHYLNHYLYPGGTFQGSDSKSAFVTISRQAGAGGSTVGELLRGYLDEHDQKSGRPWALFDKDLLKKVMEEHHLPERFAEFMKEDKVSEVRELIEELMQIHPSDLLLVRKTCETVLHLAQLGNVILVGRAANIVAGRLPGGLHVHLVGSREKRVDHIRSHFGMSNEVADDFVRTEDDARRRYLKGYFNRDVDDPLLYDLVINTDSISYNEAARLIGQTLLDRRQGVGKTAPQATYRM